MIDDTFTKKVKNDTLIVKKIEIIESYIENGFIAQT